MLASDTAVDSLATAPQDLSGEGVSHASLMAGVGASRAGFDSWQLCGRVARRRSEQAHRGLPDLTHGLANSPSQTLLYAARGAGDSGAAALTIINRQAHLERGG